MPAHHGRGMWGRRTDGLCCDVLDAWFEPSPHARDAAVQAVALLGASPDTESVGLRTAISDVRCVDYNAIALGAGSSEIIYRVLPRLIGGGKVVLLDPTYSEYEYLLRKLNCNIQRVALSRDSDWDIPLASLLEACFDADMLVLVNPNNPTGRVLSLEALSELRKGLPTHAILWIDEAYIDYSERGSTFERIACELRGVYVLKSMSKAYALSGARAAYLICHPEAAAVLREWTPPWIIGTGAQLTAGAAVHDEEYYRPLWRETIALANELAHSLRNLGLVVSTGDINAVLVQSPAGSATKWSEILAESGLYVRTTLGMGDALGDSYVRISVVRREEISRLVAIVSQSLASGG